MQIGTLPRDRDESAEKPRSERRRSRSRSRDRKHADKGGGTAGSSRRSTAEGSTPS
ncbi:hypothetical protein HaLaN_28717, partial [Haematococcus lacustris]